MKFIGLLIAAVSLWTPQLDAQVYYVSTTGSDFYPGTVDSPFVTIAKAVGLAKPGTIIYVRGGAYPTSTTINISRSGKPDTVCQLLAYPGERAIIDCSSMPITSSNRGIKLSASYWYIRGLDVVQAGDNGMIINGSYNIIEFCSFVRNSDTGLQLGGGASNNQILNCDSYGNADPGQGNADGFAPKLDVGTGNYFYGCRCWQNSDDGWDGYLRPSNNVTTTLVNCWSFANGYLSSGAPSTGNGNGFKLGGSDSANLIHNMILHNCLAFRNRVKGFDQNHTRGSITLLNCTSYSNGSYDFSVPETLAAGKVLTVENCIAMGPAGIRLLNPVAATNSWMTPFVPPTAADFVSIDSAGMRGPRKSDGSLPDVSFMHLAEGSQYVDSGTDVGLPFAGLAPDLGAFESDYPAEVEQKATGVSSFVLMQNYPNPFNPATTITFAVGAAGRTALELFDILGSKVLTLFDALAVPGHYYSVRVNASALPTGVYFYRLSSGGRSDVRKLMLLR